MTSNHQCATQSLVQAHYDDRLGPREMASVERHLTTCGNCKKFYSDLQALAALGKLAGQSPEPTPLERRRARTRLLQVAATPKEVAQAPKRAGSPRLLLAMAAAVFGVIAVWSQVGGSATEAVSTSAFLNVAAARTLQASSTTMVGINAVVTPSAQTRMSRVSTADVERVLLEDGSVTVQVARLRGAQRFVVATQDAEVEVRGTRFSVTAVQGKLSQVVVEEGLVELRHGSVSLMLSGGDSWSLSQLNGVPAGQPDPAATSAAPSTSAAGSRSARTPGNSASSSRAVAVGTPGPQGMPTKPNGGVGSRPDTVADERSAKFARAVRLMESGQHAEASSALDKFAQENDNDPRAEDAAFLAIIALQRSGRRAAAAAAARDYLRRYPNGFRRSDAARIAREAEGDQR